ncbi:MAG: DUF6231 family protein [Pseudomonadales bacterium]|nr:DUF6231 family protein [Pseudomonadales bacterium]
MTGKQTQAINTPKTESTCNNMSADIPNYSDYVLAQIEAISESTTGKPILSWGLRLPDELINNLKARSIEHYHYICDAPLAFLGDTPAVSLALVNTGLQRLTRAQAQSAIGQLRNYVATRILVAIYPELDSPLSFNDWLALGFRKGPTLNLSGRAVATYEYNLVSYNPKREWNNSKNWANPELFDKHRW